MAHDAILLTGVTGLVGGETLLRLLARRPDLRVYAIVRDPARWMSTLVRLGELRERVTPIQGDITRPGLALGRSVRADLCRNVRIVVHAAADTTFSRPLELARRVNRDGTRNLLELAAGWQQCDRFVHVSTAYVAGRMTGRIPEAAHDGSAGFVNAYEQSKHEAEGLVRAFPGRWVIARPSTIVSDCERGDFHQVNAFHRALALHHAGLASMLPGAADTPVDVVTNAYVCEAIARLALNAEADGGTFHLCAGDGAIGLGELLDLAAGIWSSSDAWRRRGIARPALTDLETYRLFEQTVEETGDPRLRRVTRSMSHFVPQLARPKLFETSEADRVTGLRPTPVAKYVRRVLERIAGVHTAYEREEAA